MGRALEALLALLRLGWGAQVARSMAARSAVPPALRHCGCHLPPTGATSRGPTATWAVWWPLSVGTAGWVGCFVRWCMWCWCVWAVKNDLGRRITAYFLLRCGSCSQGSVPLVVSHGLGTVVLLHCRGWYRGWLCGSRGVAWARERSGVGVGVSLVRTGVLPQVVYFLLLHCMGWRQCW